MTGMLLALLCALAQAEAPATGPWIESLQPAKAGPGAKIKIVGQRLAREGAQTWVLFPPDLWVEAEGATATEIVIKIPHGAEKGPIQIRVGAEAGNGRQLDVVLPFSLPVPKEALLLDKDGYAITTVSDLNVSFKDFSGYPEAEAIAKKYDGTVAGYLPGINLFTLRFKTRDLQALTTLEKQIRAEPGVDSAGIRIGLRPR